MDKQKISYQLTHDAAEDLRSIYAYTIENWGAEQAKKYLQQIQERTKLLCSNPNIGKPCIDVDATTYCFPCREHMIYYKVRKINIVIYAILHTSMLPKSHLASREK